MKNPKKAIFYFDKSFNENRNNYKYLYQLAKISDDYFKDKSIAYKHYLKFIERFERSDKAMTEFIKNRISEIKKAYFLRGESLE